MQEEKLREALQTLVGEMTVERDQVDIPGSGGLSLRMSIEEDPIKRWKGTDGKPQKVQRVHLRLEDVEGKVLARVGSKYYPQEAIEDKDTFKAVLEILAERIVIGMEGNMGIERLLKHRDEVARLNLRDLKAAIASIHRAEDDLESARQGLMWLEQVTGETIEVDEL